MKILIADDHELFLDGLSALLRTEDYVTEVVSITTLKGIKTVLDQSIDLVIIDLRMPGMRGVTHITELIAAMPTTPFIVISATESQSDIDEVMRAGAMTFIPKVTSSTDILKKIRHVVQGGREHPTLSQLSVPVSTSGSFVRLAGYIELSDRQHDVIKALANGLSNQGIATELGVSENTVKTHLAKIFKTFRVKSRVECVQKARTLGLV